MKTTRTFAISAILGFAFTLCASAKVVYDDEFTNAWFRVSAASAVLTDTDHWTKPKNGGDAKVESSKIKLDTDLDDPLIYDPKQKSEEVAIVSACFQATANTGVPNLDGNGPQAALTVIVSGADTNWYGLVKGKSANEWVKFTDVIPVVGQEYDIRIEFDLRQGQQKLIRYSVGGTVLGEGWYGNPKSDATSISTVSFSGTGDIGDFCGDNVGEVTPVASVTGTSQTDGFDYTNGTLNVAATSTAAGTATLKVVDFATGESKTYSELSVSAGSNNLNWQIAAGEIASLVPGGTYGYELTITPDSTDKAHGVVTKTGTFVAANSTNDVNWFSADATSGTGVERCGHWDTTMTVPQVEDRAYMIDDSKFVVEDSSVGSNNLTRVDASVTFESMVDGATLGEVTDAFGGFVAATENGANVWKALTAGTSGSAWVTLEGAITPAVNLPYLIRAEVSFIENNKKVRYLVKTAGADFCALTYDDGEQWLPFADDNKDSLTAVEMQGSGALAKLEANITDKALFEVNHKKFDTMEAALEEAGTNGEYAITLLTNATIEPTDQGKYEIAAGNHQYVSGGKVSSGDKTIVVDEYGEPLVRPSEATMQDVRIPGVTKSVKNIDKLRKFLEDNGVSDYTSGNGSSTDISKALAETPADADANGLALWQDYALGIGKTDSINPVTVPTGDTDASNITLAIPAIDTAKYSGDYTISYQVKKGAAGVGNPSDNPSAILIPLESNCTGTYSIKAIFTPKTEPEQTESDNL